MSLGVITKEVFSVCVRILTSALITVLVFGDLSFIFDFDLPLLPQAETVEAASGDIAIFRESTGTETVASTTNPVTNVTWDTTVESNSNITLQSDDSSIDLADGGKYLVMYNVFGEQGTSTAGTNRRALKSWLTLGGVDLAYGRSGGYIRDGDGDLDAYPAGAAIINASPGDDLQVHVQRDDTNPDAGVNIKPGTNGVSIVKLKDSWDYIRLRKTATSTDISGNTTFTDVTWDTSDETDTDSFGFTPTSGDITLKGDSGEAFLITANVGLLRVSNNTRLNYEMVLTLDGVELPATKVTTYPRGNNNTNGILSGTLVYSGIITKTSASDQVLNVEVRRESSAGASTVISATKTAFSAMKIPNTAEILMVGDTSGTQVNTSARTNFTWDTNYRVDSTAFSHTPGSSQIQIDKAGDYLFFSTVYGTTSVDNRSPYRVDWRKTGTVLNYGSHGAYNRANQSFTSGSSGGLILSGLTTSDYVELTHIDETSNTSDTVTFNANALAVQGIALNENFFGTDVLVSASGTVISEIDLPRTDVYHGGTFILNEESGSRSLTNITLTESGSVDASAGLKNIELYYDLDESAPYDCASESFSGTSTETKFGSTDTNGFSGSDGSSSFSDAVTITTERTFCGYVVYDVTENATDGETVVVSIDDPPNDVVVSGGGTVGPLSSVSPTGSVTLRNAELTQIHYHWRNDDGDETDVASNSTPTVKNTDTDGFGANTTGNDPTLTVPANAVQGDYMVVLFMTDDNNPAQTITPPASETWTLQESGSMPVDGTGAVSPPAVWVYTKVVSADDEANAGSKTYTWQDSAGSEEQAAILILLDNVSGWGEFATNVLTGTRTNIDAPSVDTSEDNEIVFHGAFKDNSAVFTGLPSGTSVVNSGWGPGTDAGAAFGLVYEVYPSNGTTGTKNFTHASNESNGFTFSLRPTNAGGATSVDGAEDTPAVGFANGTTRRVRFAVSVEGSTSSPPVQYRLEYATKTDACGALNDWVDVGVSDGGDWDVVDSPHITDGDDTTNITSSLYGAVTDENLSFVADNNALKDTSSQTSPIVATSSEFVELEYAIEPTTSAPQGNTYCFRLSDAGEPLKNYAVYAEGTISADIDVSASSSQATTVTYNTANNYLGGVFVIQRGGASRTVTDITIQETGTVDAQSGLTNIELWYDLDTSFPYDCTGESYDGGETQFGSTDTNGFSGPDGVSQFTSAGVGVDSNASMCVYVVYDTTASTTHGQTVNIEIADPSSDVVVTASSVGPSTAVSPTGSTTISGPIRTLTHYHWRNDDGDETDTGATSASGGVEDTAITAVPVGSTRRLRVQVSNEGSVASIPTTYRLEYGTKISTCDAISVWTQVGGDGAFSTSSSAFISDGNTTDIDNAGNGAMTEENTTFVGTGALRETISETSAITLTGTEYTELEFAIESTLNAAYDTPYCFRVTAAGTPLEDYLVYPELRTREKQDFYTQTGRISFTGTSYTLTAGVDYIPPSASTSAFMRITNSQLTGGGTDLDVDVTQDADDVTAYILNPENIESSVTIARPATAVGTTTVSWEIVEFIGLPGTDNEMIVRDQGALTYGASSFFATGTMVSTVADDAQVVVFITGQATPDTNTEYSSMLSTALWSATSSTPVFERSNTGSDAAVLSYAVVEFVGQNWYVQRVEHTYSTDSDFEIENIYPVVSLSQAFLHVQKRIAGTETGLEEMGHEIYLSSMGAISFRLDPGANNPGSHTSVAWVIENTQTGNGKMQVYRSNGTLGSGGSACSGAEPCTQSVSIGDTLDSVNSASIFFNNRSDGNGNAFPRPIVATRIISDTEYETWRSDTGQPQNFRAEVVDWPVADLAFRQNYYRLYVDNDEVVPTDPWPAGVADLGENSSITALNEPLGEGERVRIRMTITVTNATFPEFTKSFKLQYARRDTTCSAIDTWDDVGAPGSGEVWRGYNGTPIDGTEASSTALRISVADVAGTYEEANNSEINPFTALVGEDVEYDWVVEHNGALQRSDYCFRMTESDGTPFTVYYNYPTVRTSGYTPVSLNWRWYDDAPSVTPLSPLAAETVAPSDVAYENELRLRVTVGEVEGATGSNIKFGIQYSEYADFRDGGTQLTATSTCAPGAVWCYADGGGVDNALIASSTLSDADVCVGGSGVCGIYAESTSTVSSLVQPAYSQMEYDFALRHAGARVNTVYYFRLYDIANDEPVLASSTYPSLVTEGASLIFDLVGVPASSVVETVTTDVTTGATSVSYGSVPLNTEFEAAHQLRVSTNGTQGYQILMMSRGDFQNNYGTRIDPILSTNQFPDGWTDACLPMATGCFGYHTGDDTLHGIDSARFAAPNTYARFSTTTPEEVVYSSVPATEETTDMVYKLQVGQLQEAGRYETSIMYIAVPLF